MGRLRAIAQRGLADLALEALVIVVAVAFLAVLVLCLVTP